MKGDPRQVYSARTAQSKLGALKTGQKAHISTLQVPSVVNGEEPISFEYKVLNKDEAERLCVPHPENLRNYDRLTLNAVADILPSIEDNGFNSEVATSIEVDGKYLILKGLRRLFSVINAETDCNFRLLVTKKMSEADQLHQARTGDVYDKPSVMDLAYKLKEKKDKLGIDIRTLAQQEGMANGKVSELISFTQLPKFIISGFPGLRYIKYKWLRFFRKNLDNLDELELVLDDYKSSHELPTTVEETEVYSQKLYTKFVNYLEKSKKPAPNDKWDIKPKDNFNLKVAGDKITLSFDANVLSPEEERQLQSIISNK